MRFVLLGLMACVAAPQAPALEIPTPPNAQEFGAQVAFLDNGNIVITAPGYDLPGAADVGAVFLYRSDGVLISTLTGSTAGDRVGNRSIDSEDNDAIIKLRNGHFVVRSPNWARNLNALRAGAVTRINASTGLNGVVSASNSLVGSATDDRVGANGVVALSNGHYVVSSCDWSGVSTPKQYGAVTWSNGSGTTVGEVSAVNSMTGSNQSDGRGCRVYASPNGHYVAAFVAWTNAGAGYAGAVRWGNGLGGTVGALSVANALVGSRFFDEVGARVAVLSNGNFVTATYTWDDVSAGLEEDTGAVTWMRGTGPTSGAVSSSNSLIGLNPGDQVGSGRVTALSNGHYVVSTPRWDNLDTEDVGAVTWGNGVTGTVGRVTASNSLVGTRENDFVGIGAGFAPLQLQGAIALSNGHYVVNSPYWNSAITRSVGAVTWVNGNGPRVGQVLASNSLVGTTEYDNVGGGGVVALNNGHYVVSSYYWDNLQTSDAGAVTWRNGNGTGTGVVAADNSLVGTLTLDSIGSGGITALTNGNYVVGSSEVNLGTNPPIPSVGASTWCSGTGVTSAVVSTTNSFVGLSPNDKVSRGGVVALSNGNYVVNSPDWDGMGTENAGAVTWGIGNAPTGAFVGSGNSLVGNYNQQRFGDGYSTVATSDGSYIVYSPRTDVFDADVGMISFGTRDGATVGPIPSPIYVLGATLGGGFRMVFDYDAVRERLLVGLPADNRVELVSTNPNLLFRSGFE